MSKELTTKENTPTHATQGAPPLAQQVEIAGRTAKMFASSGYFEQAGNRDQAIAQAATKIMIGFGLGIDPATSMRELHVIQGKPTLSAGLLGSLARRAGYDWDVLHAGDDYCELQFRKAGMKGDGKVRFTFEEASAAGITNKPTWKAYRSDMLFARALSRGVRRYCSDVALGPIYTHGELDDPEPRRVDYTVSDPTPAEPRPRDTEDAPAREPAEKAPVGGIDQIKKIWKTRQDYDDIAAAFDAVEQIVDVVDPAQAKVLDLLEKMAAVDVDALDVDQRETFYTGSTQQVNALISELG